MTLVHSTAVRNAIADSVDATVNTGAATATFRLLDALDTVVYTWDLSDPAFGAATGGTITLNDPGTSLSLIAGTVTKFELRDQDSANVITGSVSDTGGGGDMEMELTTVPVSLQATLTLSWTAPS